MTTAGQKYTPAQINGRISGNLYKQKTQILTTHSGSSVNDPLEKGTFGHEAHGSVDWKLCNKISNRVYFQKYISFFF